MEEKGCLVLYLPDTMRKRCGRQLSCACFVKGELGRMRRSVERERGRGELAASRITLLIFGALVAAAVYSFYAIIPKFYRFYELENQAFGVARRSGIVTDHEIRKRLLNEMKRYDIPADPDELEILRGDGEMHIGLYYEDPFIVPWFDRDIEIYTFKFQIDVTERFTSRKQKY